MCDDEELSPIKLQQKTHNSDMLYEMQKAAGTMKNKDVERPNIDLKMRKSVSTTLPGLSLRTASSSKNFRRPSLDFNTNLDRLSTSGFSSQSNPP